MTSMQHEYCNRNDIPKIITMLEDNVLKNGWDANIGVGPGDYAFGGISGFRQKQFLILSLYLKMYTKIMLKTLN